jgi:hypothetical protein
MKVGDRLVEVLTEFPPGNALPCVTMSVSGGKGHLETHIHPKYAQLKHENSDPDKMYDCGFMEVSTFEESMLLHVWSETNAQRDNITQKVLYRLVKAWNGPSEEDDSVQIRNIGATTDLDQYGTYPPLYHTTLPLTLIYNVYNLEEAYPFLKYKKREEGIE